MRGLQARLARGNILALAELRSRYRVWNAQRQKFILIKTISGTDSSRRLPEQLAQIAQIGAGRVPRLNEAIQTLVDPEASIDQILLLAQRIAHYNHGVNLRDLARVIYGNPNRAAAFLAGAYDARKF